MNLDIFEELNEDLNCDTEKLKSKCQKLIKELHPDKNGGQESTDFLKVMKIWKILNDSKLLQQAKAEKFALKNANWDTFNLDQMEWDPEREIYCKSCRCGDQYVLDKKDILDAASSDEFCLDCETCSNTITVLVNAQMHAKWKLVIN